MGRGFEKFPGRRKDKIDWEKVREMVLIKLLELRIYMEGFPEYGWRLEEPNQFNGIAFAELKVWIKPTDLKRKVETNPSRLSDPTEEELLQLTEALDCVSKRIPGFRLNLKKMGFPNILKSCYVYSFGPKEMPLL